jgi:hypothetical protein
MCNRARFVSMAVVGLALAGCGSTNKPPTTAATSSSPATTATTAGTPTTAGPPVKSVTFDIKLTSITKGPRAANRSGRAIISIEGSTNEICWSISQLKNVTKPTAAAIEGNLSIGSISSPLGEGYVPSGCRSRPVVLLRAIEAEPLQLHVVVNNGRYPGRGVSGQL